MNSIENKSKISFFRSQKYNTSHSITINKRWYGSASYIRNIKWLKFKIQHSEPKIERYQLYTIPSGPFFHAVISFV